MAESVSVDPNRLEAHLKSPHRYLWWLGLFALVGCIIYFTKNDEVFAAASLNLSIPKEQIIEKACQWAVKLGYNPEPSSVSNGTQSTPPPKQNPPIPKPGAFEPKSPDPETQRALRSVTFSYDDDAKSFLEYELGVAKANELMVKEIPVWYWRVRLVRELQQEELRVWINPEGKLAGVDHDFENDREIPSLTHEQAEKAARKFVEEEAGNSLDGFELIKDEESQKPKRKDHSFTFEDTKKDYKGAKLRVFVGLAGNKIESYNRYLHVPESWERKFADIRSYNSMLARIAQIFMTLLMLVSVFAFGWAVMTGNIRWFPVIIIALIYSLVPFLDTVNNWNELADGYDTTITFGSYLSTEVVKALVRIVPDAFGAIILFGAAEALYRKTFPDHVAIEKLFTFEGLKSKAVSWALVAGQLLFMIDLGWVVFYYLVGQKIGFWCPLGVENFEILSSFVPALSAMRVGVSASFMEEALYRVVGMSLMMKVSGNFWVANFFQAAAWGFAHSTYPQQPFYARGVELTLGGLLDGWILRRYGILACVSSHYVFDTFLGVKPLFTSHDLTLKTSALLSVIPFVLLFIFGAIRRKGEKVETVDVGLLNQSVNETIHVKEMEEAEPEEQRISYKPIPAHRRLFYFIITVIVGFACFLMRPQSLNADAKVTIDRAQAEARAAKIISRHGIDATGYTVMSWLSSQGDGESEQYLFEKIGFIKTSQLVSDSHSGGYCWRVRFFKPKTPEEYEVQLDGDGREIGTDIHLAEDTRGAFLKKEEALNKARHEIETTYPYLKPYELESASEQKRPARTDWTFVFRSKNFDAPDAHFKVNIRVFGDLVSGANWSWELPDKWTFERKKTSTRQELAGHVTRGAYLFFIVLAAIWAVGVLKARAIKVRPALLIGALYAMILIAAQLNTLPLFFSEYSTSTPVSNYLTDQMSSYVSKFISAFFIAAVCSAFAIASVRILFPKVRLSNYFLAVLRPHNRENQAVQRTMWVDGALAGYAYVAVVESIAIASGFLRTRFSPEMQQSGLNTVSSLMNLQFPPLEALITAPVQGAQQLMIVALAVGFYARYCSNAKVYFLIATLVSLGTWFGAKHYQDAAIGFITTLIVYVINWVFVSKVAKTNAVAYFTVGLASVLFSRILSIVFHGLPVMLPTLAVSAVLLAGPAIMAAVLSMRSEMPHSEPEPAEPTSNAAAKGEAPSEQPLPLLPADGEKPGDVEHS